MNYELEQYLQFLMDYRQKNWSEWLAIAELGVNSKFHIATKISLFMENYRRKLQIREDIRRKKKVKTVIEFVKRILRVQKKVEVVLKQCQSCKKRTFFKKISIFYFLFNLFSSFELRVITNCYTIILSCII